MTVSIKI